jgi:hypothetical protein
MVSYTSEPQIRAHNCLDLENCSKTGVSSDDSTKCTFVQIFRHTMRSTPSMQTSGRTSTLRHKTQQKSA